MTVVATGKRATGARRRAGLSPEQREHAFDRFWRARPVRAPDWASRSSGDWSRRMVATSSYGRRRAAASRRSCASRTQRAQCVDDGGDVDHFPDWYTTRTEHWA